MRYALLASLVLMGCLIGTQIHAQQDETDRPDRRGLERTPPTITVNGRGEVSSAPNRAVVRLGAIAQSPNAGEAQSQINQIMNAAIEAIRALGVPEESITTVDLSLQPVYSHPRRGEEAYQPRITGFRASNTVRVQLDDLDKVGAVIDAGVEAGANQIQGISFELKDDTRQRSEALRRAARSARQKADAIAEALGVRIQGVREVIEEGAHVPYPQPEMMRTAMAMDAGGGAAVQPGQIQVHAAVTVRYAISQPDERGGNEDRPPRPRE